MFSCSRNVKVTFDLTIKYNQFLKMMNIFKQCFIIFFFIILVIFNILFFLKFEVTLLDRASSSLHGTSLEVTLSVPLTT